MRHTFLMIVSMVLLGSFLLGHGRAAQAIGEEELLAIVKQQAQQIEDLNRRLSALERATQTTRSRQENTDKRIVEAERRAANAEARARRAEAEAKAAVETSQAVVASAAVAEEEEKEPAVTFKFAPAPTLKGRDSEGRPWEFKIRGRLLVDGGGLGDKDDLYKGDNATEVRSARLGIEAKFFDGFKVKLDTDFADNEVDIKDAFLEYEGPLIDPFTLTLGQFKTPNSLEEQTSNRYTTFLERAAFTDAFALNRRIGIGGGANGENWGTYVGLFGQNVNVSAPNEGLAAAGRGWFHDTFVAKRARTTSSTLASPPAIAGSTTMPTTMKSAIGSGPSSTSPTLEA